MVKPCFDDKDEEHPKWEWPWPVAGKVFDVLAFVCALPVICCVVACVIPFALVVVIASRAMAVIERLAELLPDPPPPPPRNPGPPPAKYRPRVR